MEVKTVDATAADKRSARMLFDTLFGLRDLYWPTVQNVQVLDAFARNGQLTVSQCVDREDTTVTAWELGEEHWGALKDLGCAEVCIGCSYAMLEHAKTTDVQYDMIVIDTPQGLHSSAEGQKVEHWDFLRDCLPILAPSGVIVLYVNTEPYDARVEGEHGYDKYQEYDFDRWMDARREYYGLDCFEPEQALAMYRVYLQEQGYEMQNVLMVPCLSDVPGKAPYAFRLAFSLRETGD